MLKEFRDFAMRGNVVDLAVAVVIGAAFSLVVSALVDAFITPVIALVVGKPDFNDLVFTISGTAFPYGVLITAFCTTAVAA